MGRAVSGCGDSGELARGAVEADGPGLVLTDGGRRHVGGRQPVRRLEVQQQRNAVEDVGEMARRSLHRHAAVTPPNRAQ